MERVRKTIHYDAAVKKHLYGEHVAVGVLDSGVFMHEDLRGRVAGFMDFAGNGNRRSYDDTGHGTHVCGILAGSGRASNGKYQGMAPGAQLYVGKILNQQGEGDLSTLLQGFRWLLSIANEKHIRIINISISSASFSRESEKHQLYALFQTAYQNNISVVTAAGNQGPTGSSISLLGDSPYVICVGCHEGRKYKGISKKCQECSGRGPGLNVYRKPDVVAPGTDIVSCGLSKTQYVKKSGTSMAAPIVSGLIALAIEQNPRISAQEVKRRLIRSADDLGENYLMQGFGMVNVERMLAL